MVTKVKPATAVNPVETFREHLVLKNEAARITKRSTALKDRLKAWIPTAKGAYQNENGSVFFDLPEIVLVDGVEYEGMELRRSASQVFDEETAERILKRKKVYEEALSTYVDQDKVYRLLQEGKITESDIDKMFEEKESFAFWPVKA